MKIDKSIPATNLLGHQKLLSWYKDMERAQEPLCPLMYEIPGDWSIRTVSCGIPKSRATYLNKHPMCHAGEDCLPRIKTPVTVYRERFGPKLPKPKARLYGKGYAEPILNGKCVICEAGLWRLCYIEYGDDPAIRNLLRSEYTSKIDYDAIAKKFMAKARNTKRNKAP